MNENEVMNTEVIETTEEVVKNAGVDARDFIGIAIGIGIAVGAQFAYRRLVKPSIAKLKVKLTEKKTASNVANISEDDLIGEDN